MRKINFRAILAPRNRGILLDVFVFLISLTLMRALTMLAMSLVNEAETDTLAKVAVGLFFAGVFFLQPLGPILKRWSFHQRCKFKTDSGAGCLLIWFMFIYLTMMLLLSGTATIILNEAFFEKGEAAASFGMLFIFGGFFLSIVNTVFIYRYFLRPKKEPRWKFLMTPQAALLGDLLMFLNIICLQILWNSLSSSKLFWDVLLSTPLGGKHGTFAEILGRFIAIGALALLVYFPARIFYLAEDKNRKITWLTMLLANLPLILRAVFASPH